MGKAVAAALMVAAVVVAAAVPPDNNAAWCVVEEITVTGESARSAVVRWSASCNNASFALRSTHVQFRACGPETPNDPAQFTSITTNDTWHRLEQLHPFAEYNVEVSVVGIQTADRPKSLTFSTQSDVPETKPSPSPASPVAYQQAITFFWQSAPRIACSVQNGLYDGFHLELWGDDEWVHSNSPINTYELEENVQQFYVQKLLAFTRYTLKVFTKNQERVYNPALPLVLSARTGPSRPLPPTDMVLRPFRTSVHIRWVPSYPPTGTIKEFLVRVGVNGSDGNILWKNELRVPEDSLCVRNASVRKPTDPYCYLVNRLAYDTEYFFDVRTVNADVDAASDFTRPQSARTDPDPSAVLATTLSNNNNDPERKEPPVDVPRGMSVGHWVIILCLVTAIVALIIVCMWLLHKYRVKKLKMHYEQQLNSSSMSTTTRSEFSSPYLASMGTVSSRMGANSSWSTSGFGSHWSSLSPVDEIQSRRLPEPPPLTPARTGPSSQQQVDDGYVYTPESEYSDIEKYAEVLPPRKLSQAAREATDMDGYLRPTFGHGTLHADSDVELRRHRDHPAMAIPVASYQAPMDLLPTSASASSLEAGGPDSFGLVPLITPSSSGEWQPIEMQQQQL